MDCVYNDDMDTINQPAKGTFKKSVFLRKASTKLGESRKNLSFSFTFYQTVANWIALLGYPFCNGQSLQVFIACKFCPLQKRWN